MAIRNVKVNPGKAGNQDEKGEKREKFGKPRISNFQFFPREALEGFYVFFRRLPDHVLRQLRGRRFFVPADGKQVIPNELFIKALLGASGGLPLARPESRRIRGQGLVNQHELA